MRHQDTTQGHNQAGAPVANHDHETGTPCDRTTARTPNHDPAGTGAHQPAGHPPYRVGQTINHRIYGPGIVLRQERNPLYSDWWLTVWFNGTEGRGSHTTPVLAQLTEPA